MAAEVMARGKQPGVVRMHGSVSFVQQVPWIQNKTIRNNIVFGEELNADKYN